MSCEGEDALKEDALKKEGWFARRYNIAREIYAQPRTAIGFVRAAFISGWVAKGAGFYGLGWICTYIVLEIRMFGGEWIESDSFAAFAGSQLIEYVLRVGLMSFLNGFLAVVWPVYVLDVASGYGIPILIAGYLGFEKLLRPVIETQFPELGEAREAAQVRKMEKKQRRKEKKWRTS